MNKIPRQNLASLTKNELAKYIEYITQTEICKDVDYCNYLIKIFIKS